MLGADADKAHERWLDVLGNLSLTGYNPELSNSPFTRKRVLLVDSHFEMNKAIGACERWTGEEIRERADKLFDLVKTVWPRPAA